MRIPILDLKPQYAALETEINDAIGRVLDSGQFIMGEDVTLLEQEISDYLGVPHAITMNSGTDALMIGLRALGINPGDEVITTPFTFFATAEAVSNIGATPVFIDVDAQNFNLDSRKIEAAITANTRAILPVHLFGNPAAMTQIIEIAQKYDLKVLEDCAQSFGARYWARCSSCNGHCDGILREQILGKYTGTIGDGGAFSFFPTKNLGAYGDGGLFVTSDPKVAETARKLRVHGSIRKYENEILGYNSRLDTIQAAILRVKLRHIDRWNSQRFEIANAYNHLFWDIPGIITPDLAPGHVFHQYTLRILGGKRDALALMLKEKEIGTMVYYPVPLDRLPVYVDQYARFDQSDRMAEEVLSLPIYPELGLETIEEIAATVISCVRYLDT